MKKVTCVGYHATGSSAIDDYLKEFDNVASAKQGMECRLLQDPDGIADLEYNLVSNPHRLNSGFALKRFLLYAKQEKRTFYRIVGKKWIEWAKEYVGALVSLEYSGYWHGDIRILPLVQALFYKGRKAINLCMPKPLRKNEYFNYLPWLSTFSVDVSEEEFLNITRAYCEKLCELINTDGREFVVLDQAVSPQNAKKYLRYMDNFKVIIVDRDPRDVYINEIKQNKDHVLPQAVKDFCHVYRISRKGLPDSGDEDGILKINFEDAIYKYDETMQRINDFLGLNENNHKFVKQYFNPDISIRNTKLWEKHPEYAEEVRIIEEELPEFLYCYR